MEKGFLKDVADRRIFSKTSATVLHTVRNYNIGTEIFNQIL